jgi:hypothetical protein
VSANPPVPMSRKSCPVNLTLEKFSVTSAEVLSAFWFNVVIFSVKRTSAVSSPVFSSDTAEIL